MAAIPVHSSSPINTQASKATGPTALPTDTTIRSGPADVPATTTASSSYPAARPGAVPGPAPTARPQPTASNPTLTAPPAPTQTSNVPPPPQPGAVPSPFVTPASTITRAQRPSIPAPPKAGEIPMPASHYAPHYEQEQQPSQSSYSSQAGGPPPQMSATLSNPTRAVPPSSITSATAYNDLSHPPGYIQNSRASFDHQPETNSPHQNQNYGNNSSNGGGLLDGGVPIEESPIAQVWQTATSWAKTAGEKLKQGEEEVWRRINKK